MTGIGARRRWPGGGCGSAFAFSCISFCRTAACTTSGSSLARGNVPDAGIVGGERWCSSFILLVAAAHIDGQA